MTTFEYLAGAYTLVLSFALVRILSGLPHALQPDRRYWVHVIYLVMAVVFCLVGFWVFLSYRDVVWTLPGFMVMLAGPSLIYIYSSIATAAEPASVASWREHFFLVRPQLFGTGVLMMVQVLYSNHVFLGAPIIGGSSSPSNALLAVFAVGFISGKSKIHSVLALIPPILAIITILSISRPGSLAQ